MPRRRTLLLAIIVSILASLMASDPPAPKRGSRIYVVAVRDAGLLTLCPVFGSHVETVDAHIRANQVDGRQELSAVRDGNGDAIKVRVDYRSTPRSWGTEYQTIDVFPNGGGVELPLPPSLSRDASVRNTDRPQELDGLASDPEMKARIEKELPLKGYSVAGSPEQADFIFVVESYYMPLSIGVAPLSQTPRTTSSARDPGQNTPQRIWQDTEDGLRNRRDPPGTLPQVSLPGSHFVTLPVSVGDRVANWRDAALAIVVPRTVNRAQSSSIVGPVAASVWSGFSGTRHLNGSQAMTWVPASAKDLVDDLAAKRGSPTYLPVCAATQDPLSGPLVESPMADREAPSPDVKDSPSRDSPPATFRTNVTAVVVPFTADDSDGRPILDVKPAECHVFEDGLEQRIGGLTDVAAPVSVVLLVDTSRSTGWQKETLRAIPTAAVAGLRSQDKVMVASFDDHIRIRAEFQAASPGIAQALSSAQTGWGTRLYDALHLLIADRLGRVEGRKAIVLITDGVDTGSRLSDPAAGLGAVDASNVAVYVIRCPPRNDGVLDGAARYRNFERFVITADDRQTNVQGDDPVGAYLQRLSDGSGGRLYRLDETASLKELFGKIGIELSHQYTLYYYPPDARNDRTYRHITVSIDRPGSVVRARKGYLAAAGLAR